MKFKNSYEDAARAEAHARLEFPGTYYLAYRDLPEILAEHVRGTCALDLGCGTGRSTRFLKRLGFAVVGIDISHAMVREARSLDPDGDYRVVPEGDLGQFDGGTFDLVLSAFTFDNVPTMDVKVRTFVEMGRVLKEDGRIVNLVSSPEIYLHEWASFSTKDFPENARAKCGDRVRIIVTDIDDRRPVEDVIWPDEDYRTVFRSAGLEVVDLHRPLGRKDEPYPWVTETRIPPWVIHVLRSARP